MVTRGQINTPEQKTPDKPLPSPWESCYTMGADAATRWEATSLGLVVSAVRGQRLYTNNKWPNPVVLKIENVEYNAKKKVHEKRDSIRIFGAIP